MTRKLLLTALALLMTAMGIRAGEAQKREMRTAWIATVANIDWPSTRGTGASVIAKQKQELLVFIDGFHRDNMNAICLQVRPMADALYKSSYEPWSAYLTGTRGKDPGWDPLAFAVEECHKRGMECHVWVNPYRFSKKGGTDNTTPQDEAVKASGVLIDNNGDQVFNPALEASRKRVVDVCREMIQNYDIDGIIFDDYFYPGAGLSTGTDAPDYQLWKQSGSSLSLANWRRANVNQMVADVYNMVQATKPFVKFGIGPAGVAGTAATSASKHNVDPCPVGSDWQYNTIYSDPLAWLEEGTIDYISPQLYWKTNHATNPFGPLTKWWSYAAHHFGRHHYASHNIYFMAGTNSKSDWDEILAQINYSRQYNEDNAPGVNFYSAKYLNGPAISGFGDYLKANCFQHPALPPALTWKEKGNYDAPANLKLSGNTLTWKGVDKKLMKYSVYAFPSSVSPADIMSEKFGGIKSDYLVALTYSPSYELSADLAKDHWYAVCVVDGWNNEFDPAYLNAPAGQADAATPISPVGGAATTWNQEFKWTAASGEATYRIQVSPDSTFSSVALERSSLTEPSTTLNLATLESAATYYWRVTTSQQGRFATTGPTATFTSPKRNPAPAATLVSPADGMATDSDFVMTCKAADVQSVVAQVATDAEFANVVWQRDMAENAGQWQAICEVAAIGKGKFYWRVVTGGEYCLDNATSPRRFTVTAIPTGNYEPGYVRRRDIDTYNNIDETAGQKSTVSSLSSTWLRAVKEPYANMTFASDGLCNRGFTAYADRLLVVGRAENTQGSQVTIDHYDKATGEKLKTVTVGEDSQVAYLPGNDIFTDNAGNVLISNLTLRISSTPLSICRVNPETGEATVVASVTCDETSTGRIDHCNVWGDVNSGNFTVFAAMSSGTQLVRWIFENGILASTRVVGIKAYTAGASQLGIAPRVWPVSATLAYVKGSSTDLALYDFTSGAIVQQFDNGTNVLSGHRQANGMAVFYNGGKRYVVLPTGDHTTDTGFQFTLAQCGEGGTLAGSKAMWTFPKRGMGNVNSSTWNALCVADSVDATTTDLYFYVPGNGLAAYRMTQAEKSAVEAAIYAGGCPRVSVRGNLIELSTEVRRAELLDAAGRSLLVKHNAKTLQKNGFRGVYLLRCTAADGVTHTIKLSL